MIIIIDGYNLLKAVFHRVKGKLDNQRKHFVKQLGHYKSKKPDIKEIVLVFDGGHFRHATREISNGIVVIFSGQKSTADEWIKKYVKNHKDFEMLLVSRDRELKSKCENYGADPIDVEDFYNLVQNAILEEITINQNKDTTTQKFEDETYFDETGFDEDFKANDKILDLLMEESEIEPLLKEKEKFEKRDKDNKHKQQKLSKREKRIYQKIKKL